MIYCSELNKNFDNKIQMFKDLKKSKNDIISLKKAQIFKSYEKGIGISFKNTDLLKFNGVVKALNMVDFPTLGSPTIPHLKPMVLSFLFKSQDNFS